jgi:hypothetical protein
MNAPMVRVDFFGPSLGPSWFIFSELVFSGSSSSLQGGVIWIGNGFSKLLIQLVN